MKTSQIHTYKKNHTLRHHQKVLINFITKTYKSNYRGNILDIGCAAGKLLQVLKNKFRNSRLTGVDTSSDLIKIAKNYNIENCKFLKKDFMNLNLKSCFDIVIAGGVLAFYDDFTKPLNKMLSFLNKKGSLYITGTFNSENIDTLVKFRNNYTKSNWEKGLNSFSITTISKFLDKKKLKYKFYKFKLPFNLKKNINPIISYTLQNKNNKIILNGANIRMEIFYLIIKK